MQRVDGVREMFGGMCGMQWAGRDALGFALVKNTISAVLTGLAWCF